jgi:hypothetical protein
MLNVLVRDKHAFPENSPDWEKRYHCDSKNAALFNEGKSRLQRDVLGLISYFVHPSQDPAVVSNVKIIQVMATVSSKQLDRVILTAKIGKAPIIVNRIESNNPPRAEHMAGSSSTTEDEDDEEEDTENSEPQTTITGKPKNKKNKKIKKKKKNTPIKKKKVKAVAVMKRPPNDREKIDHIVNSISNTPRLSIPYTDMTNQTDRLQYEALIGAMANISGVSMTTGDLNTLGTNAPIIFQMFKRIFHVTKLHTSDPKECSSKHWVYSNFNPAAFHRPFLAALQYHHQVEKLPSDSKSIPKYNQVLEILNRLTVPDPKLKIACRCEVNGIRPCDVCLKEINNILSPKTKKPIKHKQGIPSPPVKRCVFLGPDVGGSDLKTPKEVLLKIYNHPYNTCGHIIAILVGTSQYNESLDLKSTTTVHLLLQRVSGDIQTQAAARAIRYAAMCKRPEHLRDVTVYVYLPVFATNILAQENPVQLALRAHKDSVAALTRREQVEIAIQMAAVDCRAYGLLNGTSLGRKCFSGEPFEKMHITVESHIDFININGNDMNKMRHFCIENCSPGNSTISAECDNKCGQKFKSYIEQCQERMCAQNIHNSRSYDEFIQKNKSRKNSKVKQCFNQNILCTPQSHSDNDPMEIDQRMDIHTTAREKNFLGTAVRKFNSAQMEDVDFT